MNVYVATWLQLLDFAAGDAEFAKLIASMLVMPVIDGTGSTAPTIDGTGDASTIIDGTPDLDC